MGNGNDIDKKEMPIFLPFVGEFGSKLFKHVPGVAGYASQNPCVVCHEVGEELIYPWATERWTYIRPASEDGRGASGHQDQSSIFRDVFDYYGLDREYIQDKEPMRYPPKFFAIKETQDYGPDIDFDVCLFPRKKEYAKGRNWQYWKEFYEALTAEGIKCFTAGQPDSCYDLGCPAVWDIAKPDQMLDATVWAIRKAKLRIGSATGTTFLSLFCKKPPILIISSQGFDSKGSKLSLAAGTYFKIDGNIGQIGWRCINHWNDWRMVMREFMEIWRDIPAFEADAREAVRGVKYGIEKPPKEGLPE